MEIVGTGLSGLVGSRISALLSQKFSFTNLSKETGVNLLDFPKVREIISSSNAPWVFHFAAYTDVQRAEDEKEKKEQSVSWQVNVEATANIVHICKETRKKLLYISTDYVFDGTKNEYEEDDAPNPISWYGRTKYEGEERVHTLGDNSLIIRISTPYRSHPTRKEDFVHKIRKRLLAGREVEAPDDQIFCPTFIDDVAVCLERLIEVDAHGCYHVVSDSPLSPYEAAGKIASAFRIKSPQISPTSYERYFCHKALPPRHAHLKHGKIDALGVPLHPFVRGLSEVVQQEEKG